MKVKIKKNEMVREIALSLQSVICTFDVVENYVTIALYVDNLVRFGVIHLKFMENLAKTFVYREDKAYLEEIAKLNKILSEIIEDSYK